MAIVQVKDATGPVLDWMVAKCAGYLHKQDYGWTVVLPVPGEPPTVHLPFPKHFSPSTRWAQGGPIIEREVTKLFKNVGGTYTAQIKREIPIRPEDRGTSLATHYIDWCNVAGPTPLLAAMRCYVASKLGDTVEVPDELL